jgi:outer membrane protein assembly factor BamB
MEELFRRGRATASAAGEHRDAVRVRRCGPLGRPALWLLLILSPGLASGQWTQWGGPRRDFTCDAGKLAEKWPDSGPPRLWSNDIGPGHSAILLDGDTLFTMCRRGDQDAILAFDAGTGEKRWETSYDAPPKPGMLLEFGPGPHSTPLVVGDRVFTVGGMVQFRCLNKKTGAVLWSHDLADEIGASVLLRGYGGSPVAYRDLVLLNVGARDLKVPGVVAFKQDTGEIAWQSEHLPGGYPTPLPVRYNGEDHLIVAQAAERLSLDPATGKTRWHVTADQQCASIMSSPIWIEPDRVFFSTAYGGGSGLFQIGARDNEYTAEELWHNKMQVMYASTIRIGDTVYGSSGDFGPAFLMATDLKTGKVLWRKRDFARASLLYADGKLVILDETGDLALATATPDGLEIHARAKVLQELAWTVPTLVGTRMYLRDEHKIMALEFGAAGASSRPSE